MYDRCLTNVAITHLILHFIIDQRLQSIHIGSQLIHIGGQLPHPFALLLQDTHAHSHGLQGSCRIGALLPDQTLLRGDLSIGELQLGDLVPQLRYALVHLGLEALHIFQQLQHRGMQLVQRSDLAAQIKVGIGNPVLLHLDAANPLVDVVEAQSVHLAAQVPLGQLQLVDLLALKTAMASLVISSGFKSGLLKGK